MDMEIDIDDMPPKVLRKLVRQLCGKKNKEASKEEDDENEEAIEKADNEREELSNLQSETNGTPPEVAVLEDDLSDDAKSKIEKNKKNKKKEED